MQEWKGGGRAGSQIITRSPKSGNQKMANIGKVKFQPPNVPVIFVLGELVFFCYQTLQKCFSGGPGSGKVTHCDTLMQEKRGVTHINMMDLLQQYAIGNGEFSVNNNHLLPNSIFNAEAMTSHQSLLISNFPPAFWSFRNYQLLNAVGGTWSGQRKENFPLWIINQGQNMLYTAFCPFRWRSSPGFGS